MRLWDARSGKLVHTLHGHAHFPMGLAFSPDGTRLASGSMDKTVKVWDVKTGLELVTLRGHDDHVWSVAFSPDGQAIAAAGPDGTIRIWAAASE